VELRGRRSIADVTRSDEPKLSGGNLIAARSFPDGGKEEERRHRYSVRELVLRIPPNG
jgi:hypothetical protein